MCYNGRHNGSPRGNLEGIPKDGRSSNRRLQLALREGGILSNRGSARRGEWPGALYTPPVTSGECTWREGDFRCIKAN